MTEMFEPVTKQIFRWGTNDEETSIMMYSHLLINGDKAVLIDPVAMPGLAQMIKVIAEHVIESDNGSSFIPWNSGSC